MEMNVGLAVAAPKIAKKINSLQIPSNLMGKIELSDLVLKYYDGFLGIGATPTIVPPPLPPAPKDAVEAYKICVKNSAGFVMKWRF